MLKAVLFDLDATLLPMDMEEFVHGYLRAWGVRIGHLVDPKVFAGQLLASTKLMIEGSDGIRTNQEIFMDDFLPKIGVPKDELLPLLDEFYRQEFLQLRALVRPTPQARQVVKWAGEQGLKVVIATNPVFPMAATHTRMEWAGLADLPIEWVTTYEQSHYCKPHLGYYREILERLGVQPQEALMVGNDMDEDMVAGELGLLTYFVTDCPIPSKLGREYSITGQGSLDQFLPWLQDLLGRRTWGEGE